MNQLPGLKERFQEILFEEIVARAGAQTVRSVMTIAEQSIAKGHNGATLADEEKKWQLAASAEGVNFSYNSWGPCFLARGRADRILINHEEG
jgi:hypothetical protein